MKGSAAKPSSSANHFSTSVNIGSTRTPRPARRTLTRSPANLSSRGRRTAWLRPFLNSLAVVGLPFPGIYQEYRPHRTAWTRFPRGARSPRHELGVAAALVQVIVLTCRREDYVSSP